MNLSSGEWTVIKAIRKRMEVLARGNKGTTCPMCKQNVKVYHRKLDSGHARGLIAMYNESVCFNGNGKGFIYTARVWDVLTKHGAQLQHWGLITEADETREDGGRAGWWRVTDKGEAFIQNRIKVFKYLDEYNGKVLERYEDEHVSIHDVLGAKFRLDDLMQGR